MERVIIITIALIASAIGAIWIYLDRKKGILEKSDSQKYAAYSATYNPDPEKKTDAKDGDQEASVFEKAYAKAPRRANIKRIIWTEEKMSKARLKDTVKQEHNEKQEENENKERNKKN